MIDIKLIRENEDLVKENIKKKFQDEKLPLVDEVKDLDEKTRKAKTEGDELRSNKKKLSEEIGKLMKEGKKEDAEKTKKEVGELSKKIEELEEEEEKYNKRINEIMMVIPNIMDPSVPIGEDDTHNVEIEKFGNPYVPPY